MGSAASELHLPTVRTEAVRLADADDRTDRRRSHRVNDAEYPRRKRLADSNIGVSTTHRATRRHGSSIGREQAYRLLRTAELYGI
ncbi:hypothetical protein [[Mycobacterium] nativiensis]|uniref:Transposase n=1 Tax=[Mycobacterium] nativiensis TaxID=2855503 RepID=A0ABU5Y525_9MYCO|nr:hypothetical protein [Mycolicibacter sp. MYC340]MEB3034055.1 hypothetical protein [Mycolicibacter sp. MYC340]